MLNVSPSDLDSIEDSSLSEVEVTRSPISLEPPIVNPWRYVKTTSRPYRPELFDHAAPLTPLRDRDVEIMAGWFDQVDMSEVEQDIDYHLSLLYPEPPWEESLDLNFLKEHL
ncbi:MAG: hypothetical protein KME10_05195 [Plectolyngbya sp. WJT66-NPBG17]|jgi:hypothetical protein|nr:hypothetical protein [Plectolyngbya sp. WJT66-NPBG17]MBW4524700.1 hypothetical protein [Phormidium tanganyikae FI6-MK23]